MTTSQLARFNEENGVKIIGNFDNEVEALRFVDINKPAIILLDYEIEKENTELLVKTLLIESPDSKVILLGEKLPDEVILNCLISTIYGYLERRDVETFLHKAICSIGKGEAWFSRRLVGLLIERLRD
ncbi:MAG: response regulator [Methyloprofundus sp.]|nr:response regulator [Methyloprofundus sp.]